MAQQQVRHLPDVRVEEAMVHNVFTVGPDTPIGEVVDTMTERKLGSAVVCEGEHVVGVFTRLSNGAEADGTRDAETGSVTMPNMTELRWNRDLDVGGIVVGDQIQIEAYSRRFAVIPEAHEERINDEAHFTCIGISGGGDRRWLGHRSNGHPNGEDPDLDASGSRAR